MCIVSDLNQFHSYLFALYLADIVVWFSQDLGRREEGGEGGGGGEGGREEG